jgi:hypothetical protein
MQSPVMPDVLHPQTASSAEQPCPALNDRGAFGFAACSLTSTAHPVHQLLCEVTGELLGEWTDMDPSFHVPSGSSTTGTPRRHVEVNDRANAFGDAA